MHVCLGRGVEGRLGRLLTTGTAGMTLSIVMGVSKLTCAECFKAFLCCCSGIRTGSLG